jgi:hypothetical protein
MGSFAVGAVVAVVGMARDSRTLVGLAVLVLLGGFLFSLIPRLPWEEEGED